LANYLVMPEFKKKSKLERSRFQKKTIYRLGKPEDLRGIAKLYYDFKEEAGNPEQATNPMFLAVISNGLEHEEPTLVLVAENKGKVVGFSMQQFESRFHHEGTNSFVTVAKESRGHGVGDMLFQTNLRAVHAAASHSYTYSAMAESPGGEKISKKVMKEEGRFMDMFGDSYYTPRAIFTKKININPSDWKRYFNQFKLSIEDAKLKGTEDPDDESLSLRQKKLLHLRDIFRRALSIKHGIPIGEVDLDFFKD